MTDTHTLEAVADNRTDTALVDQTERLIVPTKRRMRIRDTPRYVPVIRVLSARDFKAKYKQSLLGPLWLVFQPMALLVAFLVAFRGLGDVKSSNVPYAVFALVGLSVWAYFQAAMTIGAASMLSNVNFVRYTPCPRLAFVISAMIASLPSFGITALAGIVGAWATGNLSPRVVLLPLGLLWLVILTTAIVGICAALAVRYRDVISALPFMLQLGTFLAPVGYTLTGLSPTLRKVVEVNPLTGLLESMRWIVLAGYRPEIAPVAISLALTTILAIAGWFVFSTRETTMADVI